MTKLKIDIENPFKDNAIFIDNFEGYYTYMTHNEWFMYDTTWDTIVTSLEHKLTMMAFIYERSSLFPSNIRIPQNLKGFVYGNPFFYILADKILLQELDTKLVNLTSYYTVQEQIREIIDCISQITHCTFVSAKEHDALWKYDEGNPSLVYINSTSIYESETDNINISNNLKWDKGRVVDR